MQAIIAQYCEYFLQILSFYTILYIFSFITVILLRDMFTFQAPVVRHIGF